MSRDDWGLAMTTNKENAKLEHFDDLLATLQERFEQNMQRHEGLSWAEVAAKLKEQPKKLWQLNQMEETGGEPDVIGFHQESSEYTFADCSAESPLGRRNLCYDPAALASRKANKPRGSALGVAKEMGIQLLTEEQYRELQKLGAFDQKTSSWVLTPEEVRKRGGALFCDRRYEHVFTYHNGAESYYAARGFRGLLKI